eukprot:1192834-Prorocentrum_minimum.AAC.1
MPLLALPVGDFTLPVGGFTLPVGDFTGGLLAAFWCLATCVGTNSNHRNSFFGAPSRPPLYPL